MTQWTVGMRAAHKKTGHTGVVLQVDDNGKMYILWEEAHWTTRQIWGSWRWCGAFRPVPPRTPMPARDPPLPGPRAIMDLSEPN